MQKVFLYILSLSLLFVVIGILCMEYSIYLGLTICVSSVAIEYLIYKYLQKNWERTAQGLSVKIVEIENVNYDTSTFLGSYIIPLVSFNYLHTSSWLVLFIFIIVIGRIYCNSDEFYKNPTLILCGFQLYKTKIETQKQNGELKELVIVSKVKLFPDDIIAYVKISNNVGYVFNKRS